MIFPKIPSDEVKRIEALSEYSILDSIPEKEYDEITYLASHICKTPISLISLIDEKRQWFKSHHGVNATETPRDLAFCAHAINDKKDILVVPDSRNDDRFYDNPLVTSEPNVIFYAGAPLVSSDGYALGTLCVIDNQPNSLDEFQLKALKILSNQVVSLFELRKKTYELEIRNHESEDQIVGLEKFARVAAHDLKSPLSTIVGLADLFEIKYSDQLDEEGQELIKMIATSADNLTGFIDGILEYSKNTHLLNQNKEQVNINKLLTNLIQSIDLKKEVIFNIIPDINQKIYTNKVALKQIFLNLVANSIKYNDKTNCVISIVIEDNMELMKFNVIDNGPGIRKEDQERIFQIFETTSNTLRSGGKGTGIGLATVKSLVEGLGGTITLSSEFGVGTNFELTIKK